MNPIPALPDITVTISGNCNDCCENDTCCCYSKAKTSKSETIQQIALTAIKQEEHKANSEVPILLTQRIVIENKKCCVIS